MQAVAQGLKPLAFLRRFRPAQGVGVVPVRNVQHREPTLAGQPDAGRVNPGVQPAKHEHVDAFVQRHVSDPFNLGALLVNHHVVDAARHRDFAGGGGGGRLGSERQSQGQGRCGGGQHHAFEVGGFHGFGVWDVKQS